MELQLRKYFKAENCPAYIVRDADGEKACIYVNEYMKNNFDEVQWHFWVLHEVGHFALNTDDEYQADEYALKAIFNLFPLSLKKSLTAVQKLNLDNDRVERLFEVAKKIDQS